MSRAATGGWNAIPLSLTGLVLALLCLHATAGHAETTRPNIVVLLVDDLRADMLGHAGAPIRTPSIDRLAAEGVRFENAFVVASLCSPSRATLLTGVYPHVHGVRGNSATLASTPTVAQLLQQLGYATGMVGKWHMGANGAPRPGWSFWFALHGQGEYVNPVFNVDGWDVRFSGYNTDILTDAAVAFIHDHRHRPFYLHLAYKSVHAPFVPADRHEGVHDDVDWPVRPNVEHLPVATLGAYADTLAAVDESVGRIEEALLQAGVRERTVVVFTSDNGYLFGEHRLTDKRVFFEESIRIPHIVRYPGLTAAGSVRREQVLNLDLAPTLLDLAGVPVPAHMQGLVLTPLLRGQRVPWRQDWMYAYDREIQWPRLPSMLALRTKRFKYVEFPEGGDMFCYYSGRSLLFDLELDPYERRNVADDPSYADERQRLARRLAALRVENGYRHQPVDPDEARRRIERLARLLPWFARELAEHYPNGFAGWDSRVCPTGSYW